jgi:predicted transglutaminase-like cysteine proteinase
MWQTGQGPVPSGGAARLAKACLVCAIVLIGGATQAQTIASLPASTVLSERLGRAKPVTAWFEFCDRYPGECDVDAAEARAVTLTPDVWRVITTINRRVNRQIKPMTDMAHWGVVDRWDYPEDGRGDCEDYQLLKRKLLAEAGLPRRAMRMTVVIDEIGEGHAVLMLRTDRGDFILDNKTNAVLPWQQTPYVYVKRESQNGLGWAALGGAASPVVTANR